MRDARKFNEGGVQTEISFTEGIELKLKELENEFEKKKGLGFVDSEEKMQKFQKICEENTKKLVKAQVERIRCVEIESVKVEESCKYRQQLELIKTDLEKTWITLLQAQKSKKHFYKNLLIQQKSEFTSLLQSEQKQCSNKLESIKNSHQSLKSSLESELSQAANTKISYEQKIQVLDSKLNNLEQVKSDLLSKFNSDFQRARLKLEQELAEERSKLNEKETELDLRTESLSKKIRSGQLAQEELRIMQGKLEESQILLKNLREDYEKTIRKLEETQMELGIVGHVSKRDFDVISRQDEEIKVLKGEIGVFREIFEEVREKNKELEMNYQKIVRQMVCEMEGGRREGVDREGYWRIKEVCREIENEEFCIKKEMGILMGDSRLHAALANLRGFNNGM